MMERILRHRTADAFFAGLFSTKAAVLVALVAWTAIPASLARADARGTSILATPHNLSVTGGGGAHNVKSAQETRVCIYCHTPHHASAVTPLWSRDPSSLTTDPTPYQMYASTTLQAVPDLRPRRASRLCLSCHDGTIALGQLAGGYILDTSLMQKIPTDTDPRKNPNLTTDLSNDHPISLAYGPNPELNDKSTLADKGIKLSLDNYVECTSCHDPHNNQYGNFLVRDVSTQHDAICTDCHNKNGWSDAGSVHRTGGTRYPSVTQQVAADGCISCHLPHSAQQGSELLKLSQVGAGQETNCYTSCHNGASYTVNIWSQFNSMPYTHPVSQAGGHDPKEPMPVAYAKKHVQCVDCHEPHRVAWWGAPLTWTAAPAVNGVIQGVRGIDLSGSPVEPVNTEFQICFKCHSGADAGYFVSLSTQRPTRVYPGFDESLRFALGNPSFHPVTQNRQGTGRSLWSNTSPSMLSQMQRIYCNDCHDPHGSTEPHMLRAQNYDVFPSTVTNYPLCYNCHDNQFLFFQSGSATLHKSHVLDHSRPAPCASCHDPHGVPAARGATTTNAAHLINFDTRYAGLTPVYDSTARSCTVGTPCHQSVTGPQSY